VLFSHDTEHALTIVVDLVNTAPATNGAEQLPDVAALRAFVDRWEISDAGRLDRGSLDEVHALRDRLHGIFQVAPEVEPAVRRVNALIGETRISPHLTDHDGFDWHVHYVAPGTRLAEHLAAESGIALAHVVAAAELDRLRICEAPDCARVLVDLSRNRCRRYCDSRTCGNRMHVAAYRARRREALTR
jgi:hypothetical protein